MKNLKLFTETELNKLLIKRSKETKFGEQVKLVSNINTYNDEIIKSDVKYVLIGISETIGIQANMGFSKAYRTFNSTIKVLLNTQNNDFNQASNVMILGQLEYPNYQEAIKKLDLSISKDLKKVRKWVEEIDKDVAQIIYDIVKAGKTPIIIGGGHNNAYGNIKGTSLALNQSINAINFDAHTDFRALEGRHSGNGFSYAHNEGFLKKYFMFGLHENYTPQSIFETINANENITYNTYDAIAIRKDTSFKKELEVAETFIKKTPCGLEIDCDAIENISSSAQTPSGFSVEKTRQFIHKFASLKNTAYLHICEASTNKKNEKQIGKLLSYFITDFIKANTK